MGKPWIKMREDLFEDPAVLWIAQKLECRPETVVGYCHRFWGVMSRQTCDGTVTGVTLSSLGSVMSLIGFPELLVEVGWLEYDNSDPEKPIIRVPKFERHLSDGAKKRAENAERQHKSRGSGEKKVSQNSVTNVTKNCDKSATRLDKNRLDKSNKKEKKQKKEVGVFVKPSKEEVVQYIRSKGYPVDGEEFWMFYESKDWMIGKNRMKNWHAAVGTWAKRSKAEAEDRGEMRIPTYEELVAEGKI